MKNGADKKSNAVLPLENKYFSEQNGLRGGDEGKAAQIVAQGLIFPVPKTAQTIS